MPLLIIVIRLVIDHVEEPELVDTLARTDDAKPIAELLLLEEFLGPTGSISHGPFALLVSNGYLSISRSM